jgi:hypothetical protein
VIGGAVLDVTALTDLAAGRTAYAAAFLDTAIDLGRAVVIPAAALLEAWARTALEHRPFLDMLTGLPVVLVLDLDAATARDAGIRAQDAGRPAAGAGTVHAVQVAVSRGWPVLTADVDTVLGLDPHVPFESLP